MRVARSKGPNNQHSTLSSSVTSLLLRLIFLFFLDALAVWFVLNAIANNHTLLAAGAALLTIFVNVVFLRSNLYPIRWIALGLVMMATFAIYPILFTVFIAFTNFGDGHLLIKEQAIAQLEKVRYLPEGAGAYTWTAFKTDSDDYILWLQDSEDNYYLAAPGVEIKPGVVGEDGVGELDDKGIPTTIEGYIRLNALTAAANPELDQIQFGLPKEAVRISSSQEAAQVEQKYVYDEEQDVMIDQETGVIYTPVDGTFTSLDGDELIPGFRAVIGLQNFKDFLISPALRGPLVRITVWNFVFAFFSVFSTFALGLAIALLFNDPAFPGRKGIRTALLIPYTIPSLITILVWRGMMLDEIGIINRMLNDLIGWAPSWFTDPTWTKIGILLINLWLGFPYFMLICSGALQAIPSDIYNAAEVDGANIFQRFRQITLPLLLVAVGPLLVASFVFNFNNFNIIFLFNGGGPPIVGAATRAGHSDILISYVYNLAFAGGRGADYGLASAVTIIIFFIVAIITLAQFRFTNMWEEVGENV
ncbi:MAG: ABC transporter permease subunit [Chloroflexi bacterium]|nr:ABC transporter permease subunit [Chloroflexota bacterium]